MHVSEQGLFHVWAVLRESNKACFSMEILDRLFQVQGRDRKFLVKLLRRTDSYLFIYLKKKVFLLSSSCVCS